MNERIKVINWCNDNLFVWPEIQDAHRLPQVEGWGWFYHESGEMRLIRDGQEPIQRIDTTSTKYEKPEPIPFKARSSVIDQEEKEAESKLFKQGELITVSGGEYSDYCVHGIFTVDIDFDAQELLKQWTDETGRKYSDNGTVRMYGDNDEIGFLGWMNKKGYVTELPYREIHTGDYGDVEISVSGGRYRL